MNHTSTGLIQRNVGITSRKFPSKPSAPMLQLIIYECFHWNLDIKSQEDTFHRKPKYLGRHRHHCREVTFPGWSHYLGCSLWPSWEWTFPRKTQFQGSHISWVVTLPGNPHIPECQISRESTFTRKTHFPGGHILREVTFQKGINFQAMAIFSKGGHLNKMKNPLIDLRASPKVKNTKDLQLMDVWPN